MFFAQDQRDNVREENPGISFGMSMSRDCNIFGRNTDHHVQARLARSSARDGRLLMRSSASLMSRRLRLTRSVMRMRRLPTT
jgi:hypothetical protein